MPPPIAVACWSDAICAIDTAATLEHLGIGERLHPTEDYRLNWSIHRCKRCEALCLLIRHAYRECPPTERGDGIGDMLYGASGYETIFATFARAYPADVITLYHKKDPLPASPL